MSSKCKFKPAALAASLFVLISLSGCQTQKPVPSTPTPTPTAKETAQAASLQGGVTYRNAQYGFSIDLPSSWKGYSVLEQNWQGTAANNAKRKYSGPEIIIRNPAWTEKEPTQDLPVMIFTLEEWKELSEDKFHIGAAPIGPRELARNSKYIFALPARYNFAFLKGYEEVEKIVESKALKPIEIK